MKTLLRTSLAVAALTGFCLATDPVVCSKGLPTAAKSADTKGPLSVAKLAVTINWKAPKGVPVGYGTFLFKAATPVTITDLTTLSNAMTSFLTFEDSGMAYKVNSEWLVKGDSTSRTYVYQKPGSTENYKVTLKLKKGILTITVKDNHAIASMFGATNSDTGGVTTRNYALTLRWNNGSAIEVVNATCTQACNYQTKVDNHTKIRKQRTTCK